MNNCYQCEFFQNDVTGFCEECYINDNFKLKEERRLNLYKILELLNINLKVVLIDNEGKKLRFKNAILALEILKPEICFKNVLMINFKKHTCLIDIY